MTLTISLFDVIHFSAFLAHISDDTVPIFRYVLFPEMFNEWKNNLEENMNVDETGVKCWDNMYKLHILPPPIRVV